MCNFPEQNFNLNTILAKGKRFIAYQIVNRLEAAENKELLVHLESLVTLRERKKGQIHKIFKGSFDAKPIFSQKFLNQKINYIHYNPVTGKCPSDLVIRAEMLAKNFIECVHCIASFYEHQLVKHFRPVHHMDL